jgi:hypothetical protein
MKMNLKNGEVCIYTVRAECGVPTFELVGSDMQDLDIFTIEYDDSDIYTEKKPIEGTNTPLIPIPGKNVSVAEKNDQGRSKWNSDSE